MNPKALAVETVILIVFIGVIILALRRCGVTCDLLIHHAAQKTLTDLAKDKLQIEKHVEVLKERFGLHQRTFAKFRTCAKILITFFQVWCRFTRSGGPYEGQGPGLGQGPGHGRVSKILITFFHVDRSGSGIGSGSGPGLA